MPVQEAPSQTRFAKPTRQPKLSRLFKPADLSLEQWQIELRRDFGRKQSFKLKNIGAHSIFSEFSVHNPKSQSTYQVLIRGQAPGDNHCTCGDFATNTLGTCKHIEFTLAQLEKKRGGASALERGFQPEYSEVFLHYGSQREVRFRPGGDCPADLARLAGRYFGPDGALLPEAFGRFEKFLHEANGLDHPLRCREDVLQFIAEVRDAERRKEIIKDAFPRGIKSADLKKLLKADLYDYQAEGALFAASVGRCLIADEMGLGKTIQAIAAAEIMARHLGVERVLIICPTSLKHQWQREIERFIGRSAQVIGGLRPMRAAQFHQDSFFKILNYDTVHADLDLIEQWSPDLVILDEAQRIKNWSTRVARSVKRIQSPHAIVLTGTPLENRLEELISIVQFVDRFRLGPTYRLLDTHQKKDEVGKVVGYQRLDQLGATLAPVLLRRRKSEVAQQLPGRIDKNFFVPMTPQQMDRHQEGKDLVARIVAKWRRFKFLSEKDQRLLMVGLQTMRMACDSTYLIDQVTNFGHKADELTSLLGDVFETPDAKVVIFSQWLRMHEIIQPRLKDKGWSPVLFHGGVPGPKRKALVDRFRDDPDSRVFLSTDAGGVGLNLQFASNVVNVDLPWNPAVLEQRIGRVHRLGQSRPVQVFNFIAQGTIEHGMLEVLRFKKNLFAGVLDGGEKEVFLGGSRLTKFMETVEQTTGSIPQVSYEEPAEEPAEASGARSAAVKDTRYDAEGDGPSAAAGTGLAQASAPIGGSADPWSALLQTGLSFLQQLSSGAPSTPGAQPSQARGLVERDSRSGESYLKLPMPKPEVLQQVLQGLQALFGSLRG